MMNTEKLNKEALEYAKGVLGEDQADNKDAIKAISEDFKAGYRRGYHDNKSIFDLEADRWKWSFETFKDATPISSLRKLVSEAKEIEADIIRGVRNPTEYADVLMCLFDSAARQVTPIMPWEIFEAFAVKLEANKQRSWVKNDDNSYSHKKALCKTLQEIAPLGEGKQVVYVAGKVTGLDYATTQEKFLSRQRELEALGYHVINPMQLVHEEADWSNAMRICLSFLPYADHISLLHDWQDSEGATFEMVVADKLGIPVLN